MRKIKLINLNKLRKGDDYNFFLTKREILDYCINCQFSPNSQSTKYAKLAQLIYSNIIFVKRQSYEHI